MELGHNAVMSIYKKSRDRVVICHSSTTIRLLISPLINILIIETQKPTVTENGADGNSVEVGE